VPDSISLFDSALRRVLQRFSSGESCVIHCAGGVGRTGMAAIALLWRAGLDLDQAKGIVAQAGSAPENEAQWAFLKSYCNGPRIRPMDTPAPEVAAEIFNALAKDQGVRGDVFRATQKGIYAAKEILNIGVGANAGAVRNELVVIRALLDRVLPTSAPALALSAARAIGGLLRANPDFSDGTIRYLSGLRVDLEHIPKDEEQTARENLEFERESDILEEKLEQLDGIYVYTFPTYYVTPVKQDPERFWFKVGKTERAAGQRIEEQLRKTAMPEDPRIMRVYRKPDMNIAELEKQFHDTLLAAGHSRTEARRGGREWFATTLELLDQVANLLKLEIYKGPDADEDGETPQ
jgi:hypothetical protein